MHAANESELFSLSYPEVDKERFVYHRFAVLLHFRYTSKRRVFDKRERKKEREKQIQMLSP